MSKHNPEKCNCCELIHGKKESDLNCYHAHLMNCKQRTVPYTCNQEETVGKKLLGYNCDVCRGEKVVEDENIISHFCSGVLVPVYSLHQEDMTVKEDWEEEFDREFTFVNDFGEKKFSVIRVENYSQSDNIFRDDKVIENLKSFIKSLLSQARADERKRIADWANEHSHDDGYAITIILKDLLEQLK